jgi:hypothetical protein
MTTKAAVGVSLKLVLSPCSLFEAIHALLCCVFSIIINNNNQLAQMLHTDILLSALVLLSLKSTRVAPQLFSHSLLTER